MATASCRTWPVRWACATCAMVTKAKTMFSDLMELYISDHPLDCLTCAANGDCELQDMAGAVGLRDVRYGYEGENHVFRSDGALHLGPSAGLPDLRGQWRLRVAGHGRCGGLARRALWLRRRKPCFRQVQWRGQRSLDAEGRIQPLLHLRPLEMHRLLALRPRLRRSARHLCADHFR